jgi:hypothetical protein
VQMIKKLNFIMIIFFFFSRGYAEELKAGQKYKIVKPVYLIGEYNERSNKSLSKETAKAYLESASRAKMSFTAFQTEVPVGTIMTIISPAPKPWYLYFYADQYFIKLDPDLSQGLEVKFQLDKGMEGNLDGLNPEIFSRM